MIATLFAATGAASAATTFEYSGYGVVNEVNVTIGIGSNTPTLPTGFVTGYYGSGEIVLYGAGPNAGQTLDVWCIDATHDLQGSDTYTIISPPTTNNGGFVAGPNSALSHTQLGEIGALINWGNANINTYSWASAAVQLAIWTIEYPGATFTSDSGTVNTEVSTFLVPDAESATNGFAPFYGLSEVVNPNNPDGNQGLTFITPTPLPASWALMLGGFSGLGFFAYRGTKNRGKCFNGGNRVAQYEYFSVLPGALKQGLPVASQKWEDWL